MSVITGTKYAIFRVGEKKFKSIKSIEGFQGHMERTFNTPNSDIIKREENKILIGSKEIVADVEKYIEGIKLRKNGVIARELLLTASPSFFKNKDKEDINTWILTNLKFLKSNFGTNITYAVVHLDELTPHIHCLLVPKLKDPKKDRYKLRNNVYFDGKDKLSDWQDKYAAFINNVYFELKRGTKGSRTKHVKIKQYYTLINSKLDSKDLNSVIAKAKNSEVLENKIIMLQKTLELYKKQYINKSRELDIEKDTRKEIIKNINAIKKDKDIYKETIKAISEAYHISQESILNIVKSIEKGINKGYEREK